MGGPPERSGPSRGGGHRRRRLARRLAVDILYQADVREQPPSEVLEDWRRAGRKIPEYTEELVRGVERDLLAIDRVIGANSEEWTVQRMAMVDRSILRVAYYELRSGLPPAIAINEAVEAANELSTEDSGRFVNGLLGRIARGMEGEGSPG
jgi:N utilization substance protein B